MTTVENNLMTSVTILDPGEYHCNEYISIGQVINMTKYIPRYFENLRKKFYQNVPLLKSQTNLPFLFSFKPSVISGSGGF